jgi:hypothetical protein
LEEIEKDSQLDESDLKVKKDSSIDKDSVSMDDHSN